MNDTNLLTTTNIMAAVSQILRNGGYTRIDEDSLPSFWSSERIRLFEDPYSIVAVVVYETWKNLSSDWMKAQAALVELISEHVPRDDAKAWDGYLVLLTPSIAPSQADVAKIRYDTSRVRKIVSTGEELKRLSDVEISLLPLLPFGEEGQAHEEESILDILPGLLAEKGIAEEAVRVIIEAYYEQQPLVERLHNYRSLK